MKHHFYNTKTILLYINYNYNLYKFSPSQSIVILVVVKVESGDVLRHQSHPLSAQLETILYLNIPNSIQLVLSS